MRFKFLILSIITNYFLVSQNIPSFVGVSKNYIFFGKDSNQFYKFKSKLNEFIKGKRKRISIVHFGGSHVQGGFWSESIMNYLQQKANAKGGGYFVFPFQQVKTNTPYYFKTYSNIKWKVNKCTKVTDTLKPIGMCGISAITDTSCYIAVKNKWNALQGFHRIKIFHRFNSDYEIVPKFETSAIRHSDVFTEYILKEMQDSVSFEIIKKPNTYSEFILDGISCESDDAGVYYAGFGVNGATSESFFKCALLLHQLKNIQVDLFILSYGVNDVKNRAFNKDEFKQHYDTLIKMLQYVHPDASILITTISDNYIKRKGFNKRTEWGNEVIWELANLYPIVVWDLNGVMGGYKSMYKWYKAGLSARDRIHFNKKGYTLLGELMVQAFFQPMKIKKIIK